MMTFRDRRLRELVVPLSTTWLISDIAEAKGRQTLYQRQSPQLLEALREQALIQSAESSNRIEGVTVAADRLRPLVLGKSRPRDRSEQEIQGYRLALNEIHTRHDRLDISAAMIKRLHALSHAAAADAGQFKRTDNDIIEFVAGAAPVVRFRCLPAKQTPPAVDELCLLYRHALDQENIPPLIAIAGLVLDFLCIHPFRDGNGRVSRLLTLLALYQHGYDVGRYVSLERLIEQSREDYYEALQRSSANWHAGRHDLLPWVNLSLAIIRRGYVEFEQRAGQVKAPRGAKTELLSQAINGLTGEFTLTELERLCPGVSRDHIRRRLKELRAAGKVRCLGRGPAAKWRKEGPVSKRGS